MKKTSEDAICLNLSKGKEGRKGCRRHNLLFPFLSVFCFLLNGHVETSNDTIRLDAKDFFSQFP